MNFNYSRIETQIHLMHLRNLYFKFFLLHPRIHKLQHSIVILKQKVRHFSGWGHKYYWQSITYEWSTIFGSILFYPSSFFSNSSKYSTVLTSP
jgi:hypothetical protein